MQLDLTGKTALVTGSTQGIGLAIARALGRAGARVAVNGRNAEKTEAAAARLRADLAAESAAESTTVGTAEDTATSAAAGPTGEFLAVAADVTTEAGTAELHARLPAIDVLVNNLGVFGTADPLEISDAEWRRYFEVNVLSAVRLTRTYLPGMTARGWGRVQYIASDSAIATPAEMIHYGVSKTALLGVSRGFAKAATGTGVTVNSVIAGPTHTEGVEDFVRELLGDALPWEEAQRRFMREYRPQSLIQRLIEPEEIAHMVLYLASPLASATTGGALRVDGGYTDAILP